jgi:two-component system, OmpR family, phosphate regulon sensor histidine kinase PhoR
VTVGAEDQDRDVDLLRRRVLNVVGHELRTPVSTLAGLANELETCDDARLRDELVTAVARNARRLDRLVRDLLLAASIETLVPTDPPESIDLMAVARTVATGSAANAEHRGQAVARARPAAVRRAMSAILENASLYGDPPIIVTGEHVDGIAAIEVASGGPQLGPDELRLAVEAFFRGERAVTTTPGLGLGLALARTLARADGGEVLVRAGDEGGMVARLELPAA